MKLNSQIAYFGGGCFWCTEAIFKRVKGVLEVSPGYAGGDTRETNYEAVSSGTTGHAEVIKITFDPQIITYAELLDIFFATHDPTTPNTQGPDIGSQYRSLILYLNREQQQLAESAKKPHYVTEIQPFTAFIRAEDYHHDYYTKHHDQPYCQLVIAPKIRHLLEAYPGKTQS